MTVCGEDWSVPVQQHAATNASVKPIDRRQDSTIISRGMHV